MENNQRLFSLISEQDSLAEALINNAAALNSTLNLDEVLDLIFENLGNVIHYDTANIMLIDEQDGQTAKIAASRGYIERGLENELGNLTLSINNTLTLSTMFRTGEPISIFNTYLDPNWVHNKPTDWIHSYVASPIRVKNKIIGFLNLNSEASGSYNNQHAQILKAFSNQAGIAIYNATLMSDLRKSHLKLIKAYESTLIGWSMALELRDFETEGHSQRVLQLTIKLSCRLGITEPELTQVRYGALLHDIGKIGIPDAILNKPGPLNEDEWKIMRQHPEFAYHLLKQIPYLSSAIDIPYCHHEKWDGTGYPRQLRHEEIPLTARIFAIIDVWDGLCSKRPYHLPWPREQAIEYIQNQSGRHFDPQIVTEFMKMINEDDQEK